MKIDIIVPCFKAHKTLPRLLGSIISQTIVEDLEVTLVNDADEKDYSTIIKHFKPFLSIKEIKLETNSGPGVARRVGYENTSNPLVIWADADDTFANAFSIQKLREELLSQDENAICIGNFIEEENLVINPNKPEMSIHQNDMVWVFGKIYRRSFLDKYNIRMNDTRANEDNGFNTLCKILSNENDRLKFIRDVVYIWHSNPESITRINNNNYLYHDSLIGYVENMIWVFKELERIENDYQVNIYPDRILYEKAHILINLYYNYLETLQFDSGYAKQSLEYCRKYYKEVYKKVEEIIPLELFNAVWHEITLVVLSDSKYQNNIPQIGIYDFLNELKKD